MKRTADMRSGLAAVYLAAAGVAAASTVTWSVTGGTWDTTSDNWTGGSPVATRYVEGDSAVFTGAVSQTITVQGAGVTPGSITFTNSANTITLAPAAGATGFLNGGGTLTLNGAGTVVVTQGVAGATATCHGGTTVNAGILQMIPSISGTATGGVGRGTITLNGGSFRVAPASASMVCVLTNPLAVTAASTLYNNGKGGSVNVFTGPLAMSADLSINDALNWALGAAVTLAGPTSVSGANRTLVAGSSLLTVSGNITGDGGALTLRNAYYNAANHGSFELLTGSLSGFSSVTFLNDNVWVMTRVAGDNSGFAGTMHIACSNGNNKTYNTQYQAANMLSFSNAAALGGTTHVTVDSFGLAGFEYPVSNTTITNLFSFGVAGGIGAGGPNGTLTNIANPCSLLSAGGRIFLDNDLAVHSNRWGDTDPINLSGGDFYFRGGQTATPSPSERVGAVTFDYGCTLGLVLGQATSNFLVAASIGRAPGSHGTLTVPCEDSSGAVPLGGKTRFTVDSGMSTSNGMVAPYIVSVFPYIITFTDARFLNYASCGFTNAVFTSTSLATAGANDVVDSGAVTQDVSTSVYALRTTDSVTSTVPGTVVTILSGGLICKGNGKTHAVNYAFGPGGQSEAVVYALYDNTFAGNLTASSFTKAGYGKVYLSASNSIAGDITVNQGTLALNYAPVPSSNNVNLGFGSTLLLNHTNNNAINFNIGGLNGQPNSYIIGASGASRTLVVHPQSGSTFTFSGMLYNYTPPWWNANVGLTVAGAGTQVLAGMNDYRLATIVSNGTLVVASSGAILETPSVSVVSNAAFYYNSTNTSLTAPIVLLNGATIGGSGMIASALTISNGVHLAPGSGPGMLTVSNLTLTGGARYDWEWSGATNYDSVNVLNALTLTAGTTNTIRLFAPAGGQPRAGSYPILSWSGSTTPSTSVTWLVSKPAGGGAEGWPTPTVRMDTANKQILLSFANAGSAILFR